MIFTIFLVPVILMMTFVHLETLPDSLVCPFVLSKNLGSSECELKKYEKSDAAQCWNFMSQAMSSRGRKSHFYFIGDSRIRQQFQSFSKVIKQSRVRMNFKTESTQIDVSISGL